jgi:hypothetical protein
MKDKLLSGIFAILLASVALVWIYVLGWGALSLIGMATS